MAQPSAPATSREVFNPGDRREQSVLDEELLPGGSRFRLVDLNAATDEETEESGSNKPTVGDWAEAVYGHATSSLRCQRPRLPPMRDEQETSIQTSALEKALQNFARCRQELVVLPTVGLTIESMAEAFDGGGTSVWTLKDTEFGHTKGHELLYHLKLEGKPL